MVIIMHLEAEGVRLVTVAAVVQLSKSTTTTWSPREAAVAVGMEAMRLHILMGLSRLFHIEVIMMP
jgi:hypothetical protein